MSWHLCVALALVTTAVSCRDDGSQTLLEDASFGRRVFRPPPPDEVRAVPPHNIHRTGVGPYELHSSFQTTLALLPNGPRVELFKAEGLFDYRLMRTDNDALVLGVGRRNRLAFVSVLDPDIARTESGVGVGAGMEELIGALGALRTPPNTGRDSRIVTFSALPHTRFVFEKGKVVATVVMPSPPAERDDSKDAASTAPTPSCRADALLERRQAILKLAGVRSKSAVVLTACLLSDAGEAVIRSGSQVVVVSADAADHHLERLGTVSVPGLSFLAALDTGGERPELYSVAQHKSPRTREVVVTRYRLGNRRITPSWSKVALKLSATAASWIGAKIQTADFLVELTGRDRAIEVGGIFIQRDRGVLRNVVPMAVIELPDRRSPRRSKSNSPADAGVQDAGKTASPNPASP